MFHISGQLGQILTEGSFPITSAIVTDCQIYFLMTQNYSEGAYYKPLSYIMFHSCGASYYLNRDEFNVNNSTQSGRFFIFEGFLPKKKGQKKRIQNLKSESATIIIYENKSRLIKTLNNLLEVLGDRPAVVARELTKLHEEIIRGTLAECIAYFSTKGARGEFIILVGKDEPNVYFN